MPETPEERARQQIDKLLTAAGWIIQDAGSINSYASRGVAVREFPLLPGHGRADYLLYVDRQPVGVIEAKKEGDTLTGVETQAEKYSTGLPPELAPPRSPAPLRLYLDRRRNPLHQSPRPRRPAPATSSPSTSPKRSPSGLMPNSPRPGSSVRARLRQMPPLPRGNLYDAQYKAILGLEKSLAEDRPRALIQMATGSGKTYHRLQLRLPPYQARQRPPHPLPGRPQQPRTPDPQRVPALPHPGRRTPLH